MVAGCAVTVDGRDGKAVDTAVSAAGDIVEGLAVATVGAQAVSAANGKRVNRRNRFNIDTPMVPGPLLRAWVHLNSARENREACPGRANRARGA